MSVVKLTTTQLYALRDAINTEGVTKADVYFAGTLGKPGRPCAYARDRHGVERELVVWADGWAIATTPDGGEVTA